MYGSLANVCCLSGCVTSAAILLLILSGLAIQWGAVADVGIVANLYGNKEVTVGGTLPQPVNSCLATLDLFLCQPHAVLSCFVPAASTQPTAVHTDALGEVVAHILGDSVY